jgi:hypothetical protein
MAMNNYSSDNASMDAASYARSEMQKLAQEQFASAANYPASQRVGDEVSFSKRIEMALDEAREISIVAEKLCERLFGSSVLKGHTIAASNTSSQPPLCERLDGLLHYIRIASTSLNRLGSGI